MLAQPSVKMEASADAWLTYVPPPMIIIAGVGSNESSSDNKGSAMLRAFGRDLGSTIHLCGFLSLHELASLNTSCHSWRLWLDSDLPVGHSVPAVCVDSSLLLCKWARRHVKELRFRPSQKCLAHDDRLALFCIAVGRVFLPDFGVSLWTSAAIRLGLMRQPLPSSEDIDKFMARLFAHIQHTLENGIQGLGGGNFPLLRRLQLSLACKTPALSVAPLRAGFSGLHNLRFLLLSGPVPALNSLLQQVSLLVHLEELEVYGDFEADCLDLSALPTLRHLRRFLLIAHADGTTRIAFRASAAQVACLAKCTRLTELDCGVWSAMELEEWTALGLNTPLDSEEVQLESRLGTFVRSRVGAAEPALAAAPLTSLYLGSTVMTPVVWSHVSHLTSLKRLTPLVWRGGMNPQQWMQLTHFQQLTTIHPCSYHREDLWLQVDDFLPALLHCKSLTQIHLGWLTLHTFHLQQLVADLPLLCDLRMDGVRLGSVAPLSASAVLHTLRLHGCSAVDGGPAFLLQALPAMSHLTQVSLTEPAGHRLSEEEAAPLRAALAQRMPKLQRFTHNGVRTQLNVAPDRSV